MIGDYIRDGQEPVILSWAIYQDLRRRLQAEGFNSPEIRQGLRTLIGARLSKHQAEYLRNTQCGKTAKNIDEKITRHLTKKKHNTIAKNNLSRIRSQEHHYALFAPHSTEFGNLPVPHSNPSPMRAEESRCLSQRFAHGLAHAAHGDDGVDVRRVLARERRAHFGHGKAVDHDGLAVRPREAREASGAGAHRDDAGDPGDIELRFLRQQPAVDHALLEIARPVIVGGEHRRVSVLRVEHVQIGGRRRDVVVRIVRVGPEIERGAPLPPGLGHELHEPHGALVRGDRLGLARHRAAAALRFHHRTNPGLRYAKASGGARDVGIPAGDQRGRAHALLDLERGSGLRRRRDGCGFRLRAHRWHARPAHASRGGCIVRAADVRTRRTTSTPRSKCRQRRTPAFAGLAWARTA